MALAAEVAGRSVPAEETAEVDLFQAVGAAPVGRTTSRYLQMIRTGLRRPGLAEAEPVALAV